MGRRAEAGGVTPKGDRIQVRFTWRGQDLRPTLALKPTAVNLRAAERLRREILEQIKFGSFNLAQHFPDYRFREQFSGAPDDASKRTFGQWGDVWLKWQARELEHSTLSVYRTHLKTYWTGIWGDRMPASITHEMVRMRLADLDSGCADPDGSVHKSLTRKTQNNILIPLRAVCGLISKSLGIANPTDDIKCLKVQTGNPDPFTVAEVETILADLRRPRGAMTQAQADALADYYEFAAFAGPRASEQIALRWSDVDIRSKAVRIERARVLGQEKARTKTGKARVVELNDRAWAVVERQRARTQLVGPLVFLNPFTGRQWATSEEQRREWVDSLRRVGVRYRPPKELRDTSVTLALAAGLDPWWVARMHGHSIQTMQKDYAAWMPDADLGRNRAKMNESLGFRTRSALDSLSK